MKRIKTKNQGVFYREHATRKHGLHLDRYFIIRYRLEGKEHEEGLGWSSQGWTVAKAADTLSELKMNARTGKGERTLREKRDASRIARQEELERKKAEQELESRQKQENIPIKVIFEESYIPFARDNKKALSVDTEEHLFKNWLEPVIGKKPLRDITAFDCERIKKRMRMAEKSDRTIEYSLAVLRQVYNYARKFKEYDGKNPLQDIAKPKFDNRKQRFLTPDEKVLLMDTLKKRNRQLYTMALISLHSGLRAGEIFALTWLDVDIENGLLLLRDTKNTETRYGFMTDELKRELSALQPGKPSELVFKDRSGNKIKSISATWDRLIDDLGFNTGITDRRQRFTFHSLRHSFASNCVSVGVDLFRVQQLLGHKTSKMTMRYAHMRPDELKAAVLQMEKGMNEKQSEVIPMTVRMK